MPLSALPKTPILMTQLVPLPLYSTENSSGRQKPSTSIIHESQNRMVPSITVCNSALLTSISSSKRNIRATRRTISDFLRWHFRMQGESRMLARPSVHPTMIVLTYRDIPKRSRVNWVRQQNICIINISIDPPNKYFIQLGTNIQKQDFLLAFAWLYRNIGVYLVRQTAQTAYTPVKGISSDRNNWVSPTSKQQRPRAISLATHPSNTLTQFVSWLSSGFQFKKMKVRLLIGPMHKFAIISPAQRFRQVAMALQQSKSDAAMKRGRRPMRSESTPARKLPTAQAVNVKRVSVSRSSTSRKMTPSTNRPDNQNSKISSAKKHLSLMDVILLQLSSQQPLLALPSATTYFISHHEVISQAFQIRRLLYRHFFSKASRFFAKLTPRPPNNPGLSQHSRNQTHIPPSGFWFMKLTGIICNSSLPFFLANRGPR